MGFRLHKLNTLGKSMIVKFAAVVVTLILVSGCAITSKLAGSTDPEVTLPAGTVKTPGGVAQQTPEDWHKDPAEMRRSWQAAHVRLPDGQGGIINTTVEHLERHLPEPLDGVPAVIYLHGCGGFWEASWKRMDWYAQRGFAVFAPNSFARLYYPQSCDPQSFRSGLYRPTLSIRQNDLAHSLEQITALPWIDADSLVLVGTSEGAAVVTTFGNATNHDQAVAVRIAEAWTCHSSWQEYSGINAPESEPVLSLVADRDTWYNNQWQQGNCEKFMSTTNGSVSHVVTETPLQFNHYLFDDDEIQQVVIKFLRANGIPVLTPES